MSGNKSSIQDSYSWQQFAVAHYHPLASSGAALLMIKSKNGGHLRCGQTSIARKGGLQGNLGRQHIRATRLPYHVFTSRLGLALPRQPRIIRISRWEAEFWGKQIKVRKHRTAAKSIRACFE
jgi:hypothetical protein